MLNSIILMFSQCDKNYKISNIFKGIWILYAIFSSCFNFNLVFSLINISVFILITGIIRYMRKFGAKPNMILSVFSILIYSFIIDTVCYYALPEWTYGVSLVQYIANGFLFNYKYVLVNAAVMAIVILVSKILHNYKFQKIIVKDKN